MEFFNFQMWFECWGDKKKENNIYYKLFDIGGTEKQLLCLIKRIRKNYKVEVFSSLRFTETNYRKLDFS